MARKHVKLNAERKEKFLQTLRETANVKEACKLTALSRRVVYVQREKDEEFAKAWEEAIEDAVDALEAEARRRAFKGVKKPVYQGGKRVGYIQEYSDTLLIFLLKGYRPKKYAEFHKLGGEDGGPLKVEVVRFSDANNQGSK